jgi:hypothetical protein
MPGADIVASQSGPGINVPENSRSASPQAAR